MNSVKCQFIKNLNEEEYPMAKSKEYTNKQGWIYVEIDGKVYVFDKDRQFIKFISKDEFKTLINIKAVS